MYLDSTLKRKNKLEDLPEFLSRFSFPTFIQLVGNVVLASLQGKTLFLFRLSFKSKQLQVFPKIKISNYFCCICKLLGTFEEGDVRVINELIENPLKIQLKESVWKLTC